MHKNAISTLPWKFFNFSLVEGHTHHISIILDKYISLELTSTK